MGARDYPWILRLLICAGGGWLSFAWALDIPQLWCLSLIANTHNPLPMSVLFQLRRLCYSWILERHRREPERMSFLEPSTPTLPDVCYGISNDISRLLSISQSFCLTHLTKLSRCMALVISVTQVTFAMVVQALDETLYLDVQVSCFMEQPHPRKRFASDKGRIFEFQGVDGSKQSD